MAENIFKRIIPRKIKKNRTAYALCLVLLSAVSAITVFYAALLPLSIFLSYIVSVKLDAGIAGMSILILFIFTAAAAGFGLFVLLLVYNLNSMKKPMLHQIEYRAAALSDMPDVKEIFMEYAQSLDIDLSFQNFESELETLPGSYAEPEGVILLAFHSSRISGRGELCGCGALKKLEPGICEMKRLYVRNNYKGLGIGRTLAEKLLEKASDMGYRKIRLDTLSSMHAAYTLYKSLGFYEIPPYVYNPVKNAVFLEKQLV